MAAAREARGGAREPLTATEHALSKVETEAATLAAILAANAPAGHKPVIDAVTVDIGFEAALGAAFGDDLDAATDEGAPARWRQIDATAEDAALPEGVDLARRQCAGAGRAGAAPGAHRARRRVPTARACRPCCGPASVWSAATGDLWRWDGYVAAADAPRAAAQRLASRNRLAELEAEMAPVKRDGRGQAAGAGRH